MKLAYIVGPYTSDSKLQVEKNILKAKELALKVIDELEGYFPVTPHLNTAWFDVLGSADYKYYIDGTMALMLKCDVIVLVDGWQYSKGSVGEVKKALEIGMPIYNSDLELMSENDLLLFGIEKDNWFLK